MTGHWARHIQSVAFDTNKPNVMIQDFFRYTTTNNKIVLAVFCIADAVCM